MCYKYAYTSEEVNVKSDRVNAVMTIQMWEQMKLEAVRRRCTNEQVVKDAIKLATGQQDMLIDTLRKRLANASVEKAEQEMKRVTPQLDPETANSVRVTSEALGMSTPEFIKLSLDVYFDHKEQAAQPQR